MPEIEVASQDFADFDFTSRYAVFEAMISTRRNIAFIGLICLAILEFRSIPLANAQLEPPAGLSVHDCTIEEAVDRTNEAEVFLQWSNPHHQCVLVSPGTTITWNGNFAFHPLAGGVTPDTDNSSPISSAVDQGGSVVLNDEGNYPYFCEIHTNTMTGVIYVRAPLPAEFNKSEPADGATDRSTAAMLNWSASTGAASYEYCIDNSNNNACDDSWNNVGSNTDAQLIGLSVLTDYFWQVRASNGGGTTAADNGSWWNFTTSAISEVLFEDSFESTPP